MNMRRKAQISAQIFIYIMAAVIIGLIILVGYRGISSMLSTMNAVDLSSFKSDFLNEVASTARQYGSQSKFEFSLSDKVDEICFADSRNDEGEFPTNLKNNVLLDKYPLIQSSIQSDAEPNIFMVEKGKTIKTIGSFYVAKLDVEEDFLCIENHGQMSIWLRGTGKVAILYTQDET